MVLSVRERRDLETVLCEVERADVAARLEGDALAEFEAERDTINAQLRSPRRKRSIVVTALKRL